ncbi:restriction endonuclease-related protein [Nucisporomicrobium flavum]|uniref:restriction endonuclease-related protein n=1 Tax=Nucisporomicrobium flavum TaxID=2785915 RepID=UPI0018F5558E|nr:hypothetical protein [Nucisporomicrobium flavum]
MKTVLHHDHEAEPTLADYDHGPLRDDYLTVTLLSAGLAQILQRRTRAERGEPNDEALLPAAWRVGFSRLWWRCAAQGEPPTWNDLQLLALCAQPLITWPVQLDLSESDQQHALLVDSRLSEFAEQGARLARTDVEAEWVENRVHEALRTAASANGSTDREVELAYAYLRRYLIDHAVIADREVLALERRFPATDNAERAHVRRLIETAYRARPAAGPQRYLLCAGCRNIVAETAPQCGTAGCPGGEPAALLLEPLAAVYEQHRATRLFMHDPGLVEARIIDALSDDDTLAGRVRVTPYPGVDLLDVLIEFVAPGGTEPAVLETWGVDAKDQLSAHLLGRGFVWPRSMICKRRFLALPTHRAKQPGYVKDLETELDGRVAGIEVVDETTLVRRVRARAKELNP